MYQFLIAIREDSNSYANLTNAAGEVTSHISGFLNRTVKLMESGIKPVYVFDGKPPELKLQELAARRESEGSTSKLYEATRKYSFNHARDLGRAVG